MSKESYARGFCKAAEAAGVDPVALAKCAQQYKTEGWAPKNDSNHSNGIPTTTLGKHYAFSFAPTPRNAFLATRDIASNPKSPAYNVGDVKLERLERFLDPRRAAYNSASTNASQKVWSLLERAGYSKDEDKKLPDDIAAKLRKIWDDEMYRTTNKPPAHVSAPAKK